MSANRHSGSSLDSFLKDEGLLPSAEDAAIARVRAWQSARRTSLSAGDEASEIKDRRRRCGNDGERA